MNSPVWFTFARRELRGGLKGFRIFLACLMLGVAAIAGVGSVADSLLAGLRADARNILGGDVDIESVHVPISDAALAYMRSQGQVSQVTDMRSMARNPNGDQRTLAELKSVDSAYPLTGSIDIEPALPMAEVLAERAGIWGAAIDAKLAELMQTPVGLMFQLAGTQRVTGLVRDFVDEAGKALAPLVERELRLAAAPDPAAVRRQVDLLLAAK
ncbi:MAG: hypothetical protein KKB63_15010, partial [Alphaproteobacteria bacterium]|nr:hypothetical protein [Alphaproteobacteria bacterium]